MYGGECQYFVIDLFHYCMICGSLN